MSEIKILEFKSGDRIIQLTNENLKIVEGPFIDRVYRRVGIPRERFFAREEYQLFWELEIPVNKIINIDYEKGKLKITWMKSVKEGYERAEENEIKLAEYEAAQIIEAVNKLKRGVDPIILAKEYSQSFLGYREEISKGELILSIEGEEIKIESGELNRIMGYRYIMPYIASLFSRLSEVYSEKIPIKNISNVKIETKEKDAYTKEYHVKITLKNGKVKDINFYDEKEKAEKFINILSKILETTIKREDRIKYEITYKKPGEESVEKAIKISDLRSILAPTLIIYLILATLALEYVGRDLTTMILLLILSLILGMIFRKIRG